MTLDGGFGKFLEKLTASSTETLSAKNHRESISSCLNDNYNIKGFFRTGSFGNGTSVSGFSDVDYFAVIDSDDLNFDSKNALAELSSTLRNRFPSTGVYVSSPAVVLPFGTSDWERTEVTPAYLVGTIGTNNNFMIPNGEGGWMRSSPGALHDYIDYQNERLGYKLKPLIRFIKAWNFYNGAEISSFYIELFVTSYAQSQSSIIYSFDIDIIMHNLISNNLNRIIDPLGITTGISACRTESMRVAALEKMVRDILFADNAIQYQKDGDEIQAQESWNTFFNFKFNE